MGNIKNYIGCKIINAQPMTKGDFQKKIKGIIEPSEEEGYLVMYPDNYQSWSPKDVFENAYREVTNGEIELLKF